MGQLVRRYVTENGVVDGRSLPVITNWQGCVRLVTWTIPAVINWCFFTIRPTRVAVTLGGCQIGLYVDHTGCHQLVF
jgi:hypothetical protein